MKIRPHPAFRAVLMPLACALALGSAAGAPAKELTLKGEQESPAVSSAGSATGNITVFDDMSVRGNVTTTGIVGTKAHIHDGAMGMNGPVIVELTRIGDTWSVPVGTKLTAEQFKHYKAGGLYVNVHTAANPKGEIRAQLEP